MYCRNKNLLQKELGMKKISQFIIIFIIFYLIVIPIITNYFYCSSSTCLASEKITPYKPRVMYSESYGVRKDKSSEEIKTAQKKKLWPWVVGGIVGLVAVGLLIYDPEPEPEPDNDNVEVKVSW